MNNIRVVINKYVQLFVSVQGNASKVSENTRKLHAEIESINDCIGDISKQLVVFAQDSNENYKNISLWLTAAYLHPNVKYLESLHKLLFVENKGIPYEMVVDILEKIDSPRSVAILEKAIRAFGMKNDEDHAEVAISCLDALAVLDRVDAWDVIRNCASLDSSIGTAARICLDFKK